MKYIIQLSLISGLLISNAGFSLNPVDGFYGGLFGTISNGPSSDVVHFREDGIPFTGTVDYSSVGGGAGATLGYKFRQFRAEGEFLYTRISTGPLTVGTCRLESIDIVTPTGSCPQPEYDHFQAKALGYKGTSTAMYGLANAYWDFFRYESETSLVPYLGLGFGMAQIKNSNNFVNTRTTYSHGHSNTYSSAAYQGIIGLSYYMDDFAWVGMDYRYLSTKNLPDFEDRKYVLNTLNLVVNFAFDKGAL